MHEIEHLIDFKPFRLDWTKEDIRKQIFYKSGHHVGHIKVFPDGSFDKTCDTYKVIKYLIDNQFTHSIVLPLDVPFFYSEDLEKLLKFSSDKSAIIVPSRHFDGTNALVRTPINSMAPRYDEGSYSFQIESAKNADVVIVIGLIYRLMLDIDNTEDLEFVLKQNIKPKFCDKIRKIIEN